MYHTYVYIYTPTNLLMPSSPPLTLLRHVVKMVSVDMRFWKMSVPDSTSST
jgi:hypothetical protein